MRKSLLLVGLAIAGPALAVPTPLTAFDLPLAGTTTAAEPVLAGQVLSDTLVPFSGGSAPQAVSGTIQVRVVRGADSKLAYYWKINNAATSKGTIETMPINGFPQAAYDANWRKDGLGTVAPTNLVGAFAAVGIPPQWYYRFEFKVPIKPGESSRFFFLRSNAVASKPATALLQFSGGVAGPIAIQAPAT